jgi:hypothetical protein
MFEFLCTACNKNGNRFIIDYDYKGNDDDLDVNNISNVNNDMKNSHNNNNNNDDDDDDDIINNNPNNSNYNNSNKLLELFK